MSVENSGGVVGPSAEEIAQADLVSKNKGPERKSFMENIRKYRKEALLAITLWGLMEGEKVRLSVDASLKLDTISAPSSPPEETEGVQNQYFVETTDNLDVYGILEHVKDDQSLNLDQMEAEIGNDFNASIDATMEDLKQVNSPEDKIITLKAGLESVLLIFHQGIEGLDPKEKADFKKETAYAIIKLASKADELTKGKLSSDVDENARQVALNDIRSTIANL